MTYDRLIGKTPAAVLSMIATLLLLWVAAATRPDTSTRALAVVSASRPGLAPSGAGRPLPVRTSTETTGLWALASSALTGSAPPSSGVAPSADATTPATTRPATTGAPDRAAGTRSTSSSRRPSPASEPAGPTTVAGPEPAQQDATSVEAGVIETAPGTTVFGDGEPTVPEPATAAAPTGPTSTSTGPVTARSATAEPASGGPATTAPRTTGTTSTTPRAVAGAPTAAGTPTIAGSSD
ncbi:MAG: hypothetical protein ACK5RL_16325 [Acidimicrobiales bacterium]